MAVEDSKPKSQVTVVVRIRPLSKKEKYDIKCYPVAMPTDAIDGEQAEQSEKEYKSITISNPNENYLDSVLNRQKAKNSIYTFDSVFGPESSQQLVYECTVQRYGVVEDLLTNRLNCAIFVYGATGAGKTYTMMGDETTPGVVAQTFTALFNRISELTVPQKSEYSVQFSYIEIYNEVVRDLLSANAAQKLDMREDGFGEIVVANMTQKLVCSTQEVLDLVAQGNCKRVTESTDANEVSSRSHAILQVYITHTRHSSSSDSFKSGKLPQLQSHQSSVSTKLSLIDLAGSERAKNTNNQGVRMVEGANINRSLLALANCINRLAANSSTNSNFVNYRDSKLTRILKDSLSGKCKTIMIANLSPANTSYDESFNTLSYASRLRKSKPVYQFVANEPVFKVITVPREANFSATSNSIKSSMVDMRRKSSLAVPPIPDLGASPMRQFLENVRDIASTERALMDALKQKMTQLQAVRAKKLRLENQLRRLPFGLPNASDSSSDISAKSDVSGSSNIGLSAFSLKRELQQTSQEEKLVLQGLLLAKEAVDDSQNKLDYLQSRPPTDLPALGQVLAQLLLENQALHLAQTQYLKLLNCQDALLESQDTEIGTFKGIYGRELPKYPGVDQALQEAEEDAEIKQSEIEDWKSNAIFSNALEKSFAYYDGNIVEKIDTILAMLGRQKFAKNAVPPVALPAMPTSKSSYGSFGKFNLPNASKADLSNSKVPLLDPAMLNDRSRARRRSVPTIPVTVSPSIRFTQAATQLQFPQHAMPSINDLSIYAQLSSESKELPPLEQSPKKSMLPLRVSALKGSKPVKNISR